MNFNFTKPLIIAEIGLSHNGKINNALRFIKSQISRCRYCEISNTFAEHESTFDEPFRVKISKKYKNRYDYWKKTEFKIHEWKKIINFCKKKKITFATLLFQLKLFK